MASERFPGGEGSGGRASRSHSLHAGPGPRGAGPRRKRPGDSARSVALRSIRRVTEGRAYSNLALAGELARSGLDGRDRRFAADIVYGTLRSLLRLDAALAASASRPMEAVDAETLAVLRLGAYQLLYGGVPAHAAVSETVTLAPARSRGFVNAVLRRLVTDPPPEPSGHDDEGVAVRTGLAAWAVRELRRVLPPEEVEPAASALARPAGLSLRVNRCRAHPDVLGDRLSAAGYEVRPGGHHPDVLTVGSAAPSRLPGFAEGWFAVQDEASVLVTAALEVQPGERVLDACAGPGGKAGHLACLVGPAGLLVAADANPSRAALVSETARRLGVRALVLAQDARHPSLRGGFDALLVDAPCSGLGAARRRPELLWRPERSSLAALARLQVAILTGAAALLGPGGRLVYSVCTFPRAETEAAVRAFLAKRSDFEPAEIAGPGGPAPWHRLWPHRHGTDAMFYAGFRRKPGGPGGTG